MFGLKAKREVDSLIEELQQVYEDYQWTPDARILETKIGWNVFIYNEFMQGRSEHRDFIKPGTAIYRGAAFTAHSKWVMWKRELGDLSFPIAMSDASGLVPANPWITSSRLVKDLKPSQKQTNPYARIKGEVYLVHTKQIFELDRVLENGVQFKRIRANIVIPFRYKNLKTGQMTSEQIKQHRVWMYVGVPEYWSNLLDTGITTSVVRTFEQPATRAHREFVMGNYYYYSALEEDVNSNTNTLSLPGVHIL